MPEHVSASQLSMYCKCGEQYRRRYVEGEIVPPGVALVSGKSVHKAREIDLKHKMATGEDLAVEAVKESARDQVHGAFQGGDEQWHDQRQQIAHAAHPMTTNLLGFPDRLPRTDHLGHEGHRDRGDHPGLVDEARSHAEQAALIDRDVEDREDEE